MSRSKPEVRTRRLIKVLFVADQSQRMSGQPRTYELDDILRTAVAEAIVTSRRLKARLSSTDHYRLAMLLHHGEKYRLAFATLNSHSRHPKAIWLQHAIVDRRRLSRGQAQIYGTQFKRPVEKVARESEGHNATHRKY